LSEGAQARRDDLNSLLERNGTPATVTEVGDFADILRRRLFDAEPAAEVLAATAAMYRPVLDDQSWTKNVWGAIGSGWRARWGEEVAACYPFHPMLMDIAKEEWSKGTGFQRVRSTIRIFAATVYAQQHAAVNSAIAGSSSVVPGTPYGASDRKSCCTSIVSSADDAQLGSR
jgi:predicted AAA+ superfamily ATPase